QAVRGFSRHDVAELQPQDFNHPTRHLHHHINNPQYPHCKLHLHFLKPHQIHHFPFHPLHPTKTSPQDLIPFQTLPTITFNPNPHNFFPHVDQAAFS
ncbi:catalase, partial [Paenibacillus xylanexedens]|uniref:catalase n=1 Tax=Paenibacillus xylanexedens TaxID=528191 RepID=UPI0011A8344B